MELCTIRWNTIKIKLSISLSLSLSLKHTHTYIYIYIYIGITRNYLLQVNLAANSALYFTSSSLLFFLFFPISKMNPNESNTESTPQAPASDTSPPEGQWSTGICGCFEDVTSCKGILYFFYLKKKNKNFIQKYIV